MTEVTAHTQEMVHTTYCSKKFTNIGSFNLDNMSKKEALLLEKIEAKEGKLT